mgnify:CR=1 FL=1
MKNKIDKYKVIILVSRFVYWITSVLIVYMIILKLTGHSPTTGELALAMSGGMWVLFSGLAVNFSRQLGEIKSDIKHLTRVVYTIGDDIKKHINEPMPLKRKNI